MTAYLDAGFLAVLLFPAPATSLAIDLFRALDAPIILNSLHQLQIETMIVKAQAMPRARDRRLGLQAGKLWRQHLLEQIFVIQTTDWENAFGLALSWNSKRSGTSPLLLLHPGLAVATGATHFFSFDLRSRTIARMAGLTLKPATL